MALIDHTHHDVAATPLVVEVDERAARRALRAQVARLERELADALATAFPHDDVDVRVAGGGGPRLLGLEELERLRDGMALRLREARAVIHARGEAQGRAREQLERMLLEPKKYVGVRLKAADLGEGGCGVYTVRPRMGIIGMFAGWWHVKLSSGCPRPWARPSAGAPSK